MRGRRRQIRARLERIKFTGTGETLPLKIKKQKKKQSGNRTASNGKR